MSSTRAVFQDQPDQLFCDYDLVQSSNVRMYELAVVVDLAGEVRIVLLGRLEHDLGDVSYVCVLVRREMARTLEPLVSLWEAK